MSVSANEALVRRAIEAIWNRGDLDAADELFAADYVNHHGLIADLVLGPEAIKISAALYRVAFPGLHVSVEEISTVEDTVVLRWTARTAPDRLDARRRCVGAEIAHRDHAQPHRCREDHRELDRMGSDRRAA